MASLRRGVVVGLLAVASTAVAQQVKTAAQWSQEGVELGKRGKYAEAATAFKKAYELEPKATHLCNIGMAYYGRDDFARAHLYLGHCFREAGAPVAGMVEPLEYTVKQLERAGLARVTIASNPPGAAVALSSLAGELSLVAPIEVYLPAGKHTADLTLDGHEPARQTITITTNGGQTVLVAMTRIAPEPEPEPEPEPAPEPAPAPVVVEPAPPAPTPESRWSRTPAWIAGGAASAALGAAIFTRVRAGQIHADELLDCDGCRLEEGPQYDRARARVERWYHSSLALFAVSGALAVTSAVLFALPVDRRDTALSIAPSRGGAIVNLSVVR